jgi:5-(hydroxymethyl)furfural/furfural oxidase
MSSFDYAIVGCGAAGSVLANRLSADPRKRVIVVEAGSDVPPSNIPADIRSVFPLSAFNPEYQWKDAYVHSRRQHNSPRVRYPQGRVVGGTSAIMGMWALRGLPDDYDAWQAAGATGWSWKDVLPIFCRIENDIDCGGCSHGNSGPIPIRREPFTEWSPLAKRAYDQSMARGLSDVQDANSDFRDGHCVLPISRFETSRASAGICYLTEEVRKRPNLQIRTNATARNLICDDRRVSGVRITDERGATADLFAKETIVAAGAILSPALLMRSGIGPAEHLRSLNMPVVRNSEGVGANLQNHPIVYCFAWLTQEGREPPAPRPAGCTFLRWSSRPEGDSAADMTLYIRSYLAWHALGRRMACLAPVLMKPRSRGRVLIRSGSPTDYPLVEFNFLDDERDLKRLTDGLKRAVEILARPEMRDICRQPFALFSPFAGKLNEMSRLNSAKSWLAAMLLDLPSGAGRALLERLADARAFASFVEDEAALADYVSRTVSGTGHVCGTCRMGSPNDPLAVVESDGRVIGIGGLRVADASVMPLLPRANTHLPIVMVAEKISDAIIAERRAA